MTHTAQTESQGPFIKPLSQTTGFEVYMHGIPKIGEVFYRIVIDQKHRPQVEQLQLVDVQEVKSTERGGGVKVLYWKSNRSELELASGVRSKRIVRFKEKDPRQQAVKIGIIKAPSEKPKKEGTWSIVKVLHTNRRSQQVIRENVPMKVDEVRSKSRILYWTDKQGQYYWGNVGEKVVRPFPEKRNTINCSDSQNA